MDTEKSTHGYQTISIMRDQITLKHRHDNIANTYLRSSQITIKIMFENIFKNLM